MTKKALIALLTEMLKQGQGMVVNGECFEDGDPDGMAKDCRLARELALGAVRATPGAVLKARARGRRFVFSHA